MNHVILGVPEEEGFIVVGADVDMREGEVLQVVWGRRVDLANDTSSLDTIPEGSIWDKKPG